MTCKPRLVAASGKAGSRNSDDVPRSSALCLLLASFSDWLHIHDDKRRLNNAHLVFFLERERERVCMCFHEWG